MKNDFFKDSKIKYPAYEPWISNEDKKILNKTSKLKMADHYGAISDGTETQPQAQKKEYICCGMNV